MVCPIIASRGAARPFNDHQLMEDLSGIWVFVKSGRQHFRMFKSGWHFQKKKPHVLLFRTCCFCVGDGCTTGTLSALPACQNLDVSPRSEPGSQGYKKKGLTTWRHGQIHILVRRINAQVVPRRFGTVRRAPCHVARTLF